MNEGTKTGLFWAVAAVLVGLATFLSWPSGIDEGELVSINKPLFAEFTDPLGAASMKIVTFDETLGQIESFEVAKDRQTGLWSIPSRQGYPADAADQMEQAATSLLDLRILDVKTDKAEEHSQYGVVEPNLEKLSVGDAGVGRLVTIKDGDGKNLASVIIGDPVKDLPEHRYVRIPNQDPVYEVELDDSALTTQFSRWIEEDLLQLNTFDVAGIKVRNYSVAVNATLQGLSVDQRKAYDANLTLDEASQWELNSLIAYDEAQTGDVRTLGEGESLNTAKLNKLKTALDDLKIVDVIRKPDGMSADLKADKSLVSNNESIRSLAGRGFYPVQGTGEGGVDILAANGELVVDLKDGVQYVLRFGSIAGVDEGEEADSSSETGESEEDKGGSNRYLLVTTRLNEAMIPPPELKVVPQTIEELEASLRPVEVADEVPGEVIPESSPIDPAEAAPDDDTTGGTTPEEATPETTPVEATSNPAADESSAPDAPAEPSPAEGAGEEAEGDQPAGEDQAFLSGSATLIGAGQETPQDTVSSADSVETAQETAQVDGAKENESASEPIAAEDGQPLEADPQEAGQAEVEPSSELSQMTDEEKAEYLQAEQEKLEKENQRLRDEWKEKLEAGKNRVRELNARFADWYYVIPESTYSDLQIKLEELIQIGGTDTATTPAAGPPAGLDFPSFSLPNN